MKTIHSQIPDPFHPYSFFQPKEKIAFFDIETTGLSPKASSLYLIGAMCYDSGQKEWSLTQWFADNYHSEADILQAFLSFLAPFQALYHFNGAIFDVPYVLAKCKKHQIDPSRHCLELLQNTNSHQAAGKDKAVSVDLLKMIRPLKKKLGLLRANQTALEKWLGHHREDQYDGGQLISVYSDYMQKKLLHPEEADELEALLLLHNHDDMAGMLEVCSLLSYSDCLQPVSPHLVQSACQEDSTLTLSFKLPSPVPRSISLLHPWNQTAENELPPATLSLQDSSGTLTLPLCHDTLKFFFEPYKDYYYLPQEDTAVHKSVAQFVDTAFRQKATAATCYTKKEGDFFPFLSSKVTAWDVPRFYTEHKTEPAFCQLNLSAEDPLPDSAKEQLALYLFHELPYF